MYVYIWHQIGTLLSYTPYETGNEDDASEHNTTWVIHSTSFLCFGRHHPVTVVHIHSLFCSQENVDGTGILKRNCNHFFVFLLIAFLERHWPVDTVKKISVSLLKYFQSYKQLKTHTTPTHPISAGLIDDVKGCVRVYKWLKASGWPRLF